MVARRRVCRIGAVAVQALRAHMAAAAGPCRRRLGVPGMFCIWYDAPEESTALVLKLRR